MRKLIGITLLWPLLFSCEDIIHPNLPEAKPALVIDAWINNKPEKQTIKISETRPYFDAVPLPGVTGASVIIHGSDDSEFSFIESETAGEYVWVPDSVHEFFGNPGINYLLVATVGEDVFTSLSKMSEVPPIDSITFKFQEGNQFFPDSYLAEFFATDIAGTGNIYWIKAYKNGQLLNKPSEINIAYDAGFSPGSNVDGIPFIQPIRMAINPFDEDKNGNGLSPYWIGDSIYVEILSITREAFNFLTEVSIQTDRPGGFAELFSQPLSNVSTNIIHSDPSKDVIGFFNVSSASGLGKKLISEK